MAKQLNARIITKHDTQANWDKAINFIPKKGEIIIYEQDNLSFASSVPRIKIGDGEKNISSLSYLTDPYVLKDGNKVLSDRNYSEEHYQKVENIPRNPNYTDTLYYSGIGLSNQNTTFYNTGIIEILAGERDGQIKIGKGIGPNSSDISYSLFNIPGLKSAAFQEQSNFATADQGVRADNSIQEISTGVSNGTIRIKTYDSETKEIKFNEVKIAGLGKLAFLDSITSGGSGNVDNSELSSQLTNLNNMLFAHIDSANNPHGVTWAQLGDKPNFIADISSSAGSITITKSTGATSTIQVGSNLEFSTGTTVGAFVVTQNGTPQTVRVYGLESMNYLSLSGGTVTGVTTFSDTSAASSTSTGAVRISGGLGVGGNIYGSQVYGAVWNDYAEYRKTVKNAKPGQIVVENGDGTQQISTKRLQPGSNVVSDTFGFAIGKTKDCETPIACAGRALVYTYENRYDFQPGEAVCSGPNGTVSRMTREEMINNPNCIIGFVSEIPEYEFWGTENIKVDKRIWIKVK